MPRITEQPGQNTSDHRTTQIPEQLGFQNSSDSRTARIRTAANSKMSQLTGTRPKSSPRVDDEGPIRIDPANATISPTVGANCRGGNHADATGWLILGPNGRLRIRERVGAVEPHTKNTKNTKNKSKNRKNTGNHKDTTMYPGSGPS